MSGLSSSEGIAHLITQNRKQKDIILNYIQKLYFATVCKGTAWTRVQNFAKPALTTLVFIHENHRQRHIPTSLTTA